MEPKPNIEQHVPSCEEEQEAAAAELEALITFCPNRENHTRERIAASMKKYPQWSEDDGCWDCGWGSK